MENNYVNRNRDSLGLVGNGQLETVFSFKCSAKAKSIEVIEVVLLVARCF